MMSSSGRKEENDALQRLIPSLSPRVQLAIQVAAKPSLAAMFTRLADARAHLAHDAATVRFHRDFAIVLR
jgi:hypothetical protein